MCNGLTNAIKYSNAPVNGPIRVYVRTCVASATTSGPREALHIDVLDHGEGLGDTDEATLFTDFAAAGSPRRPLPAARSHGVGSSGVGLPICARCVGACAGGP